MFHSVQPDLMGTGVRVLIIDMFAHIPSRLRLQPQGIFTTIHWTADKIIAAMQFFQSCKNPTNLSQVFIKWCDKTSLSRGSKKLREVIATYSLNRRIFEDKKKNCK